MTDAELAEQIAQWRELGCGAVKIKIGEAWGSCVGRDLDRVRQLADQASGAALMVDANGGYTQDQARRVGAALDDLGVVWFEEPVSSDDIHGLGTVRQAVRCAVAAGEYVSDEFEAAGLCDVVDCLQLDATRCGGYTGFMRCSAVARANNLQVSAHCAPALHVPIAAATTNLRHLEYFADHVRLEPLLFDGIPVALGGVLTANESAGHGYRVGSGAREYRI
jgi:L-alanine-DL-glutamate epimerase-like enolase superfamily enzyme